MDVDIVIRGVVIFLDLIVLVVDHRCFSGGGGNGFVFFFLDRSLSRGGSSGSGPRESGHLLLVGGEDDGHVAAFEHRALLDHRDVVEAGDNSIEQGFADLRMGDFPPAKHDRDLDFVTLFQQFGGGPRFEVDIVVVDFRLHAHFAELHILLVFLGLALLLGLFVLEAAEVHQPGDWRGSLGGNLDQVDIALAGHAQRLGGLDDTDLAAFLVDQADFRHADAFVDARLWRRWLWRYLRSFPQTAPRDYLKTASNVSSPDLSCISAYHLHHYDHGMSHVSTAVVLAAGLGTRMLPATKAVPKEMLPIVDRPLIQYSVEEALAAGITTIVFVVASGKESIIEHFQAGARVETAIRETGNQVLADSLAEIAGRATFHSVYQERQLGIAHAVNCARAFLEGQPFALMFPDDIILGERSCVGQLADAYNATRGSVIAVEQVADADVSQYGIVDPVDGANPARLRAVVEKPRLADAPSRLGIVGRYILSETIFEHIDRIPPGKDGELQITDALASQIASGEAVWSYQFEGTRYDTGRPLGYIVANVAAALQREDLAAPLSARLNTLLAGGR